jgi:hypothetical protein
MATAQQAADHIFISVSRFRDLIAGGTITRQPTNGYKLDRVREQYCKNAQKVMQGRAAEGGKALSTARARLAEAQAESAETKNAIARGDYTETKQMVRIVEGLFGVCRENILGLPGKVADAVAGYAPGADRPAIYRLIYGEARELLVGLSTEDAMLAATLKKMATAEAGDGVDVSDTPAAAASIIPVTDGETR